MRNTGAQDETGGTGTVQSVDRAVSILEFLAQHGTLGVTALAKELGVHKSTASRLVAALERRGLVEQVEERGQYRIGVGILRLAGATSAASTWCSRPDRSVANSQRTPATPSTW